MTTTYTNNRNQAQYWAYDADGRDTWNGDFQSYHDAAGRRFKTSGNLIIEQTFDGDGARLKQIEDDSSNVKKRYYVNSSVLGMIYEIEQAGASWVKRTGVVYLNGQRIAIQNLNPSDNTTQAVRRFYENPATGATRGTIGKMASEPDPMGVNNGVSAPIQGPPDTGGEVPDFILPSRIVDPSNMTNGCSWGGLPISCDSLEELHVAETHVYTTNPYAAPFGDLNGNISPIRVNQGTGYGSPSDATNHGMGAFGVPSERTPQTIRDTRMETEGLHFVGMWQTQQQTTPLPKNLSTALSERLKVGGCAAALTKLLEELKKSDSVHSTDVNKLLDRVLKEGGVKLAELNGNPKEKAKLFKKIQDSVSKGKKPPDLKLGEAYFQDGKRIIDLQSTPVFPNAVTTTNTADNQHRYLTTLIHELFHHAKEKGLFDHDEMAAAALKVDSTLSTKGKDDSDIFDSFVNKYCPPK